MKVLFDWQDQCQGLFFDSKFYYWTISQWAGKLDVLTEIESKSESGQLECSLQFPKHHKRWRKVTASKKSTSNSSIDLLTNENIEKTICRAFDDAYDLLSRLDVNVVLEKKKNYDASSEFVCIRSI